MRNRRTFVAAVATLLLSPAAAGAATVTGTLVERHGDRLDGTATPAEYFVVTPSERIRLTDPQDPALIGTVVTVADEGARAGVQGTAVDAPGEADRPTFASPAPGPRTTLAILVALADVPQTRTPDEVRTALFAGPESASLFYFQQSDGMTWLTGIQNGPGDVASVAIGLSGATCDVDAIADAADQAAGAQGWTPGSYTQVLYVLPHLDACGWGGLGETPGRRAWTNGYLDTSVTAHEFGHLRGVHHANALDCVDGNGTPVPLSDTCTSREYQDPFDVMGLPERLMSSFHRAQMGDLPASSVTLVTQSGTYPLSSADGAAGVRLLLVPRKLPGQPVTRYYALERRSARSPFDVYLPTDAVTRGVTVRLVPRLQDSIQTDLIDMHPLTNGTSDAPLQPGESFGDPLRPITLTVTPAGDAVQVSMPALVDDVPPVFDGEPFLDAEVNRVSVQWDVASDDVGVARYEIERNGAVVGSTTATTYTDAPRGRATARYRVIAIDAAGNRGYSAAASVFVPGRPTPRVGAVRRVAHRVVTGRRAWVMVERFSARNATRMRATINRRQVIARRGSTLTVRVRIPFNARRRRVLRVFATNATSSNRVSWIYPKP